MDSEGSVVEALQLIGPTILTTVTQGEIVGEMGQWLISQNDIRLSILSNEIFTSSFTKVI